jgi:hypothetical protein
MFRTLADAKNCSSAQMNAVLGLKFVEFTIPKKKVEQKADAENSDRDTN